MLSSIRHILTGHKVQWYTDNQNVTRTIDRGSTKPDLQTLAEEIVNLCNNHRVSVIPVWVHGMTTNLLIISANSPMSMIGAYIQISFSGLTPCGVLSRLIGLPRGTTPNAFGSIPASGTQGQKALMPLFKIGREKTIEWYPLQAK